MPRPGYTNRVAAKCHPDRPHMARGLCGRCYAALPERRAKSAAYGAAYNKAHPKRDQRTPARKAQQLAYRNKPEVKARFRDRARDWDRSRRHESRVYLVLCEPHARSHGEWYRADEISADLLEFFKEGLL